MPTTSTALTTPLRALILVSVGLLYAALMANWWYGWIRSSSPRVNYLFMCVVFSLPVVLVWLAWTSNSDGLTFLGSALSPICLLSLVLLLGNVARMTLWVPEVVSRDIDRSFERLRQERVGNDVFGVYRTNGGATTSFGIVVRKERPLIPGLLLVSEVCSSYPADDVKLTRVEPTILDCEFPGYAGRRPRLQRVDLTGKAAESEAHGRPGTASTHP